MKKQESPGFSRGEHVKRVNATDRLAQIIDDALARFWEPRIAAQQASGMHAWRDGSRIVVRDPRFARHHGHTRGETCAPH